jgi:tetratricopeptide (TPR) repeat protein
MNRLARSAAQQALTLDSTVVEAYVGEANALINDMRFADAVRTLRKGYAMDSANVDVLANYGVALLAIGRVEDGVALLQRARERDPLSAIVVGLLGYGFELLRRYDESIPLIRAVVEMDPRNVLVRQSLGFAFAFANMPDSAVHTLETAFALDSTLFGRRSNLVFAYAIAGRWNDASRQRALLAREVGVNSPNYYRMMASLAFGEYDAAMGALERGVADREPLFGIGSIPCDPLFDPLKSDRRFGALMQRLGARACPASGKWPIAPRPR